MFMFLFYFFFLLPDFVTALYEEYNINTRSTQPTEPTDTTVATTPFSPDSFSRPIPPHVSSMLPGNNNGIPTTPFSPDSFSRPIPPHVSSMLPGNSDGIPTTPFSVDSFTKPTQPHPTSMLPGNNIGIPTTSVSPLQCTIAPMSGTIFDGFNITCNPAFVCSNCQYCFKTLQGKFHSFGRSEFKRLRLVLELSVTINAT